jgi:hypothetical protein
MIHLAYSPFSWPSGLWARVSGLLLLLLALEQASGASQSRPPVISEVRDAATFSAYAHPIETDEVGKFLIDLKSDRIYYFDVNLYRLHYDFVSKFIMRRPMTPEERKAYFLNYGEEKPDYILGALPMSRSSSSLTTSSSCRSPIRICRPWRV